METEGQTEDKWQSGHCKVEMENVVEGLKEKRRAESPRGTGVWCSKGAFSVSA